MNLITLDFKTADPLTLRLLTLQTETLQLLGPSTPQPLRSDPLSAELLIRHLVYYSVNKKQENMKLAIIGSGNIGRSVGAWASGVRYGMGHGTFVRISFIR
jgi:hypothetical protein